MPRKEKNRKRACIIPNIFISKGWEICASTGGFLFPKRTLASFFRQKSVLTVYTQPIDPQITAEGKEDEKVRNIFLLSRPVWPLRKKQRERRGSLTSRVPPDRYPSSLLFTNLYSLYPTRNLLEVKSFVPSLSSPRNTHRPIYRSFPSFFSRKCIFQERRRRTKGPSFLPSAKQIALKKG